MSFMTRVIVGSFLVAGAFSLANDAIADDFPNKPIRFIAPIPAGGSTEILARDVAQGLSEHKLAALRLFLREQLASSFCGHV